MITLEESIQKIPEFCRTDEHFRDGPYYGKEMKLVAIFELDDDAWGFSLDYVHPERDRRPPVDSYDSEYLDGWMPKVFNDGRVAGWAFHPVWIKRRIEVTSALQLHIDPLPA